MNRHWYKRGGLGAAMVVAALIAAGASTPRMPRSGPAAPRVVGRQDPDMGAGNRATASADNSRAFALAFPRKSIAANAFIHGVHQSEEVHSLGQLPWRELGPVGPADSNVPNPKTKATTAVSGRLTAIAVDPSTCSATVCGTIYIGEAGGGVWKSTNTGQSWTPLLDDQPVLSVGAITLDPQNPNIVYVGTGDAVHGYASHSGIGILMSTDGGQTWTILGQNHFQNRAITSIVIDPRAAGATNATLYAGTNYSGIGGSATIPSEDFSNPTLPYSGIYKSIDGGQTWTSSIMFKRDRSAVDSLMLDPRNPDVLYAGFDERGVYRSADAGRTWRNMDSGLPSQDVANV